MVTIEVNEEQAHILRSGPKSSAENDPWRVLFRSLKAEALRTYGFGGSVEWVDQDGRRVASAHLG